MGEQADYNVAKYSTGQWGLPIPEKRNRINPSKNELRNRVFSIVKVSGVNTNRIHGTKLVVCDADAETYYVWASNGVTGIRKDQCTVIESYLAISIALKRLNRRTFETPDI